MDYSVRIQMVYDSILKETKKELVVIKDCYKKVYVGALFFELEPYECLETDILHQVKLEDPEAKDIILAAYDLLKKEDMLSKRTLKTMAHWQGVNGVTNDFMIESYRYKTDEEYYEFLRKETI